jgi:mRNA interferase MazF
MKTAISVDDRLMSEADNAAREMGLSRSRLIATALEAYLRKRRQDEITERLNEVYAEVDPAEARILKLMKEKFHATGPVRGSAPAERHPCVVVQSDAFNRSRIASTVVCLITSNDSRFRDPGNVRLKKGDANLPKDSVVNVTQVQTVDRSELSERIGKLPANIVDAVPDGLQMLFDRM